MEHLALEIFDTAGTGSSFATLPEDASITITDTSEVFASGDVWSYPFTLNIRANAHIFGTSGEIHGSRLHEQVDRRRARLWVEGLPMYLGYIRLGEEADVDENGNIEVTFESGQKTFEEMIEGAKANQVPMMGDVLIGMALWRKRWVRHWMKLQASTVFSDGTASDWSDIGTYTTAHGHDGDSTCFEYDGEEEGNSIQQYPRMVFPKGEFYDVSSDSSDSSVYENENGSFGGQSSSANYTTESVNCINTDYPYDAAHPYCNIALCYQRYGYEKKKEENGSVTTYNDYGGEPEAQRGYEYMPASRVNSAPNFYVIYWINALMKHLGIHIDENQMMDVEDLRRLFFVNTNCAYEEPDFLRTVAADERFGKYRFKGTGSGMSRLDVERLVAEYTGPEGSYGNGHTGFLGPQKIIKIEESGFAGKNIQGADSPTLDEGILSSEVPDVERILVKIKSVEGWTSSEKKEYEYRNSYLHKAYASSDCFPNADVADVIHALESGFGIRFLFSDSYQRVRIVLLRNIFRSEGVQEIACDIISDTKTENCIRGFRMTYGDQKEDTSFYYKGFADMLPHIKDLWPDTSDKHDYSHWKTDAVYGDIIQKVSAFDKTCYVTPLTGNAYGIKIDKDAKRYEELHPSLFEYAAFMDAEDGDCTGEEETIETVTVNFTPAIMNDLNMEAERNDGVREQRFALFVDEKMRPRRPDLSTGTDYNAPDAVYEIDKLYAKTDKKYDYEGMMSDGVVKPGEFAITSDMFASKDNISATVKKLIKYVDVASGDSYESIPLYATWNFTMGIDGHINEGYRLYLQDNFEPNDDGVSPVETHDWGLMLGIMRGSGSDAYVEYTADDRDGEGNDTWEIVPGSSATAHPDTCDSYGNEWDYDGSYTVTPANAAAKLAELFPDSDAPFYSETLGYVTDTKWGYWLDSAGNRHVVLMASEYSLAGTTITGSGDIRYFVNLTLEELIAVSATRHFIIEVDSSPERGKTLVQLCRMAYGGGTESAVIDNGVGSRYGRISLKLRAEKLNPYFDPSRVEGSSNRRYLPVTDENLRGRGLCDAFYKEYSYWERNARIARREVRMELAQLLAIDKTRKASVGDVTGFIRKMQYTVGNKTGLGVVTMEIMYI